MKKAKFLLPLTTLLMVSQVVLAKGSYPIVDTDQTLFYDNSTTITAPKKGEPFYGQDAHHIGNTPSYTDNGDGTITDNVTGLLWQKEFEVISYDEAMEKCKTLTLGGKTGWRLPSIKEAYSLIMFSGVDASSRNMDSAPQNAIPFLNTTYFSFKYGSNGTRAIDTQMLSSTIYVGSSERQTLIFGVNMADGRIKAYPMRTREGGKKFTIRLVHGNEYGVNQFVDNKDKTITDLATSLMWQKEDSQKGMNWEEALKYVANMNKKKYLGYSDWRLPNAKELQSIVDYSRSPQTTSSAAIDPIFKISTIKNEQNQTDYPFFWSSTTHCSSGIRSLAGAAAYVCFGRGMGNMQQMMMGNQQNGNPSGNRQGGGNREFSGNRQGGNNRGGNGSQRPQQTGRANSSTSSTNWIDVHGAGCQRSDPKSGSLEQYTTGRGPQGDAIRINNYIRLVRDLKQSVTCKFNTPQKLLIPTILHK